jgi:ABC-type branched-subunit amino acid transport system permease subunit
VASDGVLEQEPRHRRSHHTAELPRHHFSAESAYLSPREVTRRRRVNVLYGLVAANAITLFLGLTTGSTAMVYLFTVAFLGLGAYCYILVQIRNQEYLRRYYGQRRAA